jgi:hypothetical protein
MEKNQGHVDDDSEVGPGLMDERARLRDLNAVPLTGEIGPDGAGYVNYTDGTTRVYLEDGTDVELP